jgi:hypothetical protein
MSSAKNSNKEANNQSNQEPRNSGTRRGQVTQEPGYPGLQDPRHPGQQEPIDRNPGTHCFSLMFIDFHIFLLKNSLCLWSVSLWLGLFVAISVSVAWSVCGLVCRCGPSVTKVRLWGELSVAWSVCGLWRAVCGLVCLWLVCLWLGRCLSVVCGL